MVALLSGLGGPVGFGETLLQRNDDGSTAAVDITAVFENGLDFFGVETDTIYINNNGSITLNAPRSTFTPDVITAESGNPEITPFFADVDTGMSDVGPDEPAGLPTGGGNSRGSNLVWYDIDPVADRITVTWDDVGFYSRDTSKRNAFQLILTDEGGGDFDIEFRYESVNWTTGNASGGTDGLGGTVARAGWTAGTGNADEFFELPQSGDQDAMLALDTSPGNTGQPGRWFFPVRSGVIVDVDLPEGPDGPKVGTSWGDPHLLTFDGVPYDFMPVGEFVLAREIGGGIEVQARHAEVAPNLTINSAVATRVGGASVMVDATRGQPLLIDGAPTAIDDFTAIQLGNGIVGRAGNTYTVVYPGADGIANDGDERMIATVIGGRVDIRIELAGDRAGGFEGLLGNANGNPADDIALANGQPLPRPLQFGALYGDYLDDWRVGGAGLQALAEGEVGPLADTESLFSYEPGQGPDDFYVPDSVERVVTLADLPLETRQAAEQAATDAGLEPGTFNFNAAVLDFATTEDRSFLEAGLVAPETDEEAGVDGRITPNQAQQVAYLYEAGLDRDGNIDLPGLNFWIDRREEGLSERALSDAFLRSPEFNDSFGEPFDTGAPDYLDDEALVIALYENVLDREFDQPGLDFWLGVLQQPNVDRADLLLAFAASDENVGGSPFVETLIEAEPGEWAFA